MRYLCVIIQPIKVRYRYLYQHLLCKLAPDLYSVYRKNTFSMTFKKILSLSEIAIIVVFAIVPLLISLPFRVNIFLSWEGAYRMSEGQIPFRDFGVPLGGMYWVVPAIFFKIFGAQMISLVKAQTFLNIISGLAFRSICKSVQVLPSVRCAGVLLYCLSFSFINFWPWYNHSVIVYAFVALALVLKGIMNEKSKSVYWWAIPGGLFTFFSFFTKQDGGGMIFAICCALLLYYSWYEKKWSGLVVYLTSTIFFSLLAILYFSQYNFSYWFNHGQPPHNARLSVNDIANIFWGDSMWLKFYFFVVIFFSILQINNWKTFLKDKQFIVFALVTISILCFATVFQVTSYTPDNSNIFFHSFGFVFIFHYLGKYMFNNQSLFKEALILSLGVLFWWSSLYWNYMQRILKLDVGKSEMQISASGENVVNMHNAIFEENVSDSSSGISQSNWVSTNLYTLRKITMPEPTVKGIDRFLKMDIVKNKKDIRILNMSELTFLAAEIPYTPETGPQFPLWYHLGVGMFNKQAEMFEKRIDENYYDLVLFEYIPTLNNFYPFRVRDSLLIHYQKIDSFPAPRNTNYGTIEVFVKK